MGAKRYVIAIDEGVEPEADALLMMEHELERVLADDPSLLGKVMFAGRGDGTACDNVRASSNETIRAIMLFALFGIQVLLYERKMAKECGDANAQ